MILRTLNITARFPRPNPLMKMNLPGNPPNPKLLTMTPTTKPPTPETPTSDLRFKGVSPTLLLSNFWPNGLMTTASQPLVILMQLLTPNLRVCRLNAPRRPALHPVPLPARLLRRPRLPPKVNNLRSLPPECLLARLISAGPGADLS